MDNKDQLDYEIGVMMFRAITALPGDAEDYDIESNFKGIIDALSETHAFNKSTMLCGFENEWQNANGSYDKEAIQSLFSEANETFEIRYEGEV